MRTAIMLGVLDALLSVSPVCGQTNFLLDNAGGRLTAPDGSFLLAQATPGPLPSAAMTVLVNQSLGASPNTQNIQMVITQTPEGIDVLSLSTDPVAKIAKIVFLGGTKTIQTCSPKAATASVECRASWAKSAMSATGKNTLTIRITLGNKKVIERSDTITLP